MLDRTTLQTLAEKLDTNRMTLKEARDFVYRTYRVEITGRTRDTFLRNLAQQAENIDDDAAR